MTANRKAQPTKTGPRNRDLPFHVDHEFVPVNADPKKAIAAHREALSMLKRTRKKKQRATALNCFRAILLAAPKDVPEALHRLEYLHRLKWPIADGERAEWLKHLLLDLGHRAGVQLRP